MARIRKNTPLRGGTLSAMDLAMVFGLIGAGLKIAQTVKGVVDVTKGAKAEGGGGGGEAAAAKKADAAGGGDNNAAEANNKEETIDRFLKQLDSPNVRSLADIKGVRDRVMGQVKKNGMNGEDAENARCKLNHAILAKLRIGKPGPDGKVEVELTDKNRKILEQLGMKPDDVKAAGGGAANNAAPPANNAAPPANNAAPPANNAAPKIAGPPLNPAM